MKRPAVSAVALCNLVVVAPSAWTDIPSGSVVWIVPRNSGVFSDRLFRFKVAKNNLSAAIPSLTLKLPYDEGTVTFHEAQIRGLLRQASEKDADTPQWEVTQRATPTPILLTRWQL